MMLELQPNFHEPGRQPRCAFPPGDDFFNLLLEAHRDLTVEQSAMVNARLILLLANHIGNLAVLREAMEIARDGR